MDCIMYTTPPISHNYVLFYSTFFIFYFLILSPPFQIIRSSWFFAPYNPLIFYPFSYLICFYLFLPIFTPHSPVLNTYSITIRPSNLTRTESKGLNATQRHKHSYQNPATNTVFYQDRIQGSNCHTDKAQLISAYVL